MTLIVHFLKDGISPDAHFGQRISLEEQILTTQSKYVNYYLS